MASMLEEYRITFGFGGFPQKPKQKRWYVCNLGFDSRNDATWFCKETDESKIQIMVDEYMSIPYYVPRFLDSNILRRNLKTQIPVALVEPSKSLETLSPKRWILYEQPPGFPSGRPVPSSGYKDAHKQPKNPFQ
jgi:hypothetical protein